MNISKLPPIPNKETLPSGKAYTAKVGIDSGETRIEAGQLVPAEILAKSPWLIEQGIVQEVKAK